MEVTTPGVLPTGLMPEDFVPRPLGSADPGDPGDLSAQEVVEAPFSLLGLKAWLNG